jgi:Cyanobacterial TRADD-N associated 2-Transmembrane domain
MTDFTKYLIEASPAFSITAIIIITLYFIIRIWLQYKQETLKTAPERQAKLETSIPPESLDNLSQLLVQNFRILNQFYSENLSQYRTSSIASISIAVLGFIVIISGVLIAVIGNQVTLGSISSAAGIVSEAAAMLFFKQNQSFQNQMEGSLKKLVSTQYLMTSISLARELEGNESKTEEIKKINDHLRKLMDGLHESKS